MAGIVAGAPPAIDLAAESRLIEALLGLAGQGLLASAHDLSDGGLAVTLAECCFASAGLSADVSVKTCERAELGLFGESGARAVVTLGRGDLARVLALAAQYKVAVSEIGTVSRGPFRIQWNGKLLIGADVSLLRDAWAGAIERAILGQPGPGKKQ